MRSVAMMFISLATLDVASAGDFSDSFDRVQQVWDNVTSFQQKAWQATNDTLSSTTTEQVNQVQKQFWNDTAPQEVTDASKLALKQIFPGVADAVDVADKVDKYASQWASQAQNNAQSNLNSLGQKLTGLKNQISDYFEGNTSASPQGGNPCPIFAGGICPPCPNGPSDANGNCPNAPMHATNSISSADLASIGASNTGTPAAPTSLAADAQQLPGQLSSWDQQQAAIAQARLLEQQRQAQLAAQAAAQAATQQREYERQQRELQTAQTYVRNQRNTTDDQSVSDQTVVQSSDVGTWANILTQGLGLVQQIQSARGGARGGGGDCADGLRSHNCVVDGTVFQSKGGRVH